MSDQDTTQTAVSGTSRRDFLKKSAVATGAVWAAPSVLSVGARAFATGSEPNMENVCADGLGQTYRTKIEFSDSGSPTFKTTNSGDSFGCPGGGQPDGYAGAMGLTPAADGKTALLPDGGYLQATPNADATVITITIVNSSCLIGAYSVKSSTECDFETISYDPGVQTIPVPTPSQNAQGKDQAISNIGLVICCVPRQN